MTLAEIISKNYKLTKVFRKYGLDFCCGGKKTLTQACLENNIQVEVILSEIGIQLKDPIPVENYSEWEIEELIDYLISFQHKYVKKNIPPINDLLSKSFLKHSLMHHELNKIRIFFSQFSLVLLSHMQREEQILFPYINNLCACALKNEKLQKPEFGTLKFLIGQLEQEHEKTGQTFRKMKTFSNNFALDDVTCETLIETYAKLNEFEENLHLHYHLENNILFPKALSVEEELLSHV